MLYIIGSMSKRSALALIMRVFHSFPLTDYSELPGKDWVLKARKRARLIGPTDPVLAQAKLRWAKARIHEFFLSEGKADPDPAWESVCVKQMRLDIRRQDLNQDTYDKGRKGQAMRGARLCHNILYYYMRVGFQY